MIQILKDMYEYKKEGKWLCRTLTMLCTGWHYSLKIWVNITSSL